MRRLASIALLVLLVSSMAFAALPAHAQNTFCFAFEYSVTNLFNFTATETVEIYHPGTGAVYASHSITLAPGATGTNRVSARLSANDIFDIRYTGTLMGNFFVTFAGISDCSTFGEIGDGRLNDGPTQLAAPLAAYCADGGIAVWDIADDGQGTLGFTASQDDITAGIASAASSGQNVLVAEGLGNQLYALTTGELTLAGPDVKEPGKLYTYILPGNLCAR